MPVLVHNESSRYHLIYLVRSPRRSYIQPKANVILTSHVIFRFRFENRSTALIIIFSVPNKVLRNNNAFRLYCYLNHSYWLYFSNYNMKLHLMFLNRSPVNSDCLHLSIDILLSFSFPN